MKLAPAILVASVFAGSVAQAAVRQNDATAPLPSEMIHGQVHYLTGGIGRGEEAAFRKAEHRYPLALEFANRAKPHDEFTADVKVDIRDAKGKTVLDAVSGGPFLFAKLPAGRYDIKATQDGKTLERHANVVAGKSKQIAFVWPAK